MEQERIKALETKGFKRWTKAGKDRLYINATKLGLECKYYNTGNISSATFKGERISNSFARKLKNAKTYLDIETGKVHSDFQELEDAAKAMIER